MSESINCARERHISPGMVILVPAIYWVLFNMSSSAGYDRANLQLWCLNQLLPG